MEAWNITAPMRPITDVDKRKLLASAIKNNCRSNAVYAWTPYIGELGIFERARVTWAKNPSEADYYMQGIINSAKIAPDFNACSVKDAFAYYFGY